MPTLVAVRTRAAISRLKFLAHPIASFDSARVPLLARHNYRSELVAITCFAMALGMIEGGTLGVVVKNAYDGVAPDRWLNYAVGIISAAPEFANLTSFLWAARAHARPKVRFVNSLQIAVLVLVAIMALLPHTALGLALLVFVVILARASATGILTLRSTVWRVNYPREYRARVTGKLAVVQSLVVAGSGLTLGLWMESSVDSFRYVLLAAAALGIVGVVAYSKVRVRHERLLLKNERAGLAHERPSINPISILRTLRDDRSFKWFMVWMFTLGSGNLMLTAPLVITLREQFHLGYLGGIVIIQSIPYIVMPLAIPFWARLLDRVHVVRFRALHSWFFVAAQACVLIATLLHALPLMFVATVLLGIAFAGGALAWNLGHLDFAPAHKASQYMSVHVTLTGVRGLLAPLIAVSAYEWLDEAGASAWVFALSVVLCVAGAIGFVSLSRRMNPAPISRTPSPTP